MPDKSLINALNQFRQMEFFVDREDMSNMDLAVELGYDVTIDYENWGASDDLILLAHDHDRVWWEEVKAGVEPVERVYQRVIRDWAQISRGAFKPDVIREYWGDDAGPVWIKVQEAERTVRLHPRFLGPKIDLSILAELNNIVKDSGFVFALHEPHDSMAFVVALTPDEMNMLSSERSWRFMPPVKFNR